MKVIVTVGVRNSEWYWSKEDLIEAGDYRKEWEALNEDKVEKFLPSDTFEIGFDVDNIIEDRKTGFDLLYHKDGVPSKYHLEDVSVFTFLSKEGEKVEVVISNPLIHQYIAAKQKEYAQYVYIYLNENIKYKKGNSFSWMLVSDYEKIIRC
jgi:hypothetical protein